MTSPIRRLRPSPALALSLLLLALLLILFRHALWPAAGRVLGGVDLRTQFYPWLETVRQAVHAGRLPLWDPHQFAGYPLLANPQIGFFYPPTWLAWLLPVNVALSWYTILHLWLAGVGMLLFTRHQGAGWTGAALAALTFTFSGFISARLFAGHLTLLATITWLPWILLALTWSVRQGSPRAAVVAGLPVALAILAGNVPFLLYIGLIILIYILFLATHDTASPPQASDRGDHRQETPSHRRPLAHAARQLLIAAVTGLALSAVQLLPFLRFATASTRATAPSFDFAANYSLPPAHLITLLIPDYFGEPLTVGYWSVPLFEELTYYAGVLPIVVLILAIRKPGRRTWFYVALIITGLWIALGRYTFLYRLLFDWVPPFRFVRAPARAAFLFTFAVSALLGLTTSRWQRVTDQTQQAILSHTLRWLLAVGLFAGVAALAATGAVFAAQHPTAESGRLWHQLGGWAWFLLAFAVACGLLSLLLTASPTGKKALYAGAGLALLIVADLWLFGHKFVRLEPVAPNPLWNHTRTVVGQTDERVLPWGLSVFEQNGAGRVGLNSVFGYNPLEPASLTALTSSVPDPRSTAYDLLSARYVVSEAPLDNFAEGNAALEFVANEGNAWIYRRPDALPLARLVYHAETIAGDEAALERIHAPDFDPATTAILHRPPPCSPGPDGAAGTAAVLSHDPTTWHIQTDSAAPALLILAETDDPGWQVTVDGEPAQSLTAYTTLRAVCVPAGEHTVVWNYRPLSLWIGAALTLIASTLWAAAAITIFRRNPIQSSINPTPTNHA